MTTLLGCVLLAGCSKPDGPALGENAQLGRSQIGIERDDSGARGGHPSHKSAADQVLENRARTEASGAAPSKEAAGAGARIRWFPGVYAGALAMARARDLEVFVDFGAAWCPPCQELHDGAFEDLRIRGLLERLFVSITIDVDVAEGPQLVDWYGIGTFPTLLRVDGNGNEVARLVEEVSPTKVLAWLETPRPPRAEALARAKARHEAEPTSGPRLRARALAEISDGDAAKAEALLQQTGSSADHVRDVIAHWGLGNECGEATRASLRRRVETKAGAEQRDAVMRLATLVADSSPAEAVKLLASLATTHGTQAAWACAQLELPAIPCLAWIPPPTGDSLGDAALAALEARLALGAGDAARAERSMERARRLAPKVAAYRRENHVAGGAL